MINIDKVPRGSCVIVKWEDTVTTAKWTNQDEFLLQRLELCATVGVLMGSDKKVVHIAHNLGSEDCDGTTIPRSNIVSVEVVKRARKTP